MKPKASSEKDLKDLYVLSLPSKKDSVAPHPNP
jgi:hypothetical protein